MHLIRSSEGAVDRMMCCFRLGAIFAALVKARRIFRQPEWIGFTAFPAFIIIIIVPALHDDAIYAGRHRARARKAGLGARGIGVGLSP